MGQSAERKLEYLLDDYAPLCLALALVILSLTGVGNVGTASLVGLILCGVGLTRGAARADLGVLIPLVVYDLAVLAGLRGLCRKKPALLRAGTAAYLVHNLMDTSFFYLGITALTLTAAGQPESGGRSLSGGAAKALFALFGVLFLYSLYFSMRSIQNGSKKTRRPDTAVPAAPKNREFPARRGELPVSFGGYPPRRRVSPSLPAERRRPECRPPRWG